MRYQKITEKDHLLSICYLQGVSCQIESLCKHKPFYRRGWTLYGLGNLWKINAIQKQYMNLILLGPFCHQYNFVVVSAHIILPRMIAVVNIFSVKKHGLWKCKSPKYLICTCLSLDMIDNVWKSWTFLLTHINVITRGTRAWASNHKQVQQ